MTLHMLRLDPDMTRAARWGAEGALAPPGADPGYLWHALLIEVFGEAAPKPWRLVERPGAPPHLLGYATADRTALVDHAASFADPSACAAVGLDTLSVKAMPEHFPLDKRLGFEVRLRPTARSSFSPDGSGRRGGRHRVEIDAALHAALAAREADPHAPLPDADEIYRSWLAERLARSGAQTTMEEMRFVWRRRAAIVRKDDKGRKAVHGRKGGGPDICVAGVLKVAEPDQFATLLARGVGRHRAFGFGMLLLRPV